MVNNQPRRIAQKPFRDANKYEEVDAPFDDLMFATVSEMKRAGETDLSQDNIKKFVSEQGSDRLVKKYRRFFEKNYSPIKTAIKINKVGRNDPCPCNSGAKFKRCCGK